MSATSPGETAANDIALDEQTHTLYVASDVPTKEVAVLNTATCNANDHPRLNEKQAAKQRRPRRDRAGHAGDQPSDRSVYAIYAR